MEPNRNAPRAPAQAPEGTIWVSETLRNGAAADTADEEKGQKEEKVSVFWRIFGGTILSIVALVVVTLFNYLTSSISEIRNEVGYLNKDLRKELTRLGEGHGELVKKDELSMRTRSLWDSVKELRAEHTTVTVLKERTAALEQQLKTAEAERKELARELQRLREARVVEEDRKELLRELQRLRERLAAVEGKQPANPSLNPAVHRQ